MSARYVPLLCALSACTLVGSFQGYDTVERAQVYAVSGVVDGLDGDAVVTLQLNGGYALVAGNGPFTFPSVLLDGASYVVSADSSTTTQSCAVTSGSGRVAGASVADVSVHCASDDATLAALSISTGPLAPSFDPATHAYSLVANPKVSPPFFTPTLITVTATLAHPFGSNLVIGGASATSGLPTAEQLQAGTHALHVGVTAADGTVGPDYVVSLTGHANDYIKASNTKGGASFGGGADASSFTRGRAVAMDGDTLVVGSPLEASVATDIGGNQSDTSTPGAGAVYVFVRTGDTWTQQAYIKPPYTCYVYESGLIQCGCVCAPEVAAHFGSSVAISGDTIVVGAPNQPWGQASAVGSAYVYVRSGTTWTRQAILTAFNAQNGSNYGPGAGASFGQSIAIDGDTLAIGAPGDLSGAKGIGGDPYNTASYGAGAVFVLTRANGFWTNSAYIKASNTRACGDYTTCAALFGSDVALHNNTLAVGAPGEASNATGINGDQSNVATPHAGAVYVFTSSGVSWTQQAYVKTSSSLASYFGGNVTLSNTGDALVAQSAKGFSVFRRSAGVWVDEADVALQNADSAALSSDGEWLAVGVSSDASAATGIDGDATDVSAPNAGAVHVFAHGSGAWPQRGYVKASNTHKNAFFGRSIFMTSTSLVVGSPGESSSSTGIDGDESGSLMSGAGAVYVF